MKTNQWDRVACVLARFVGTTKWACSEPLTPSQAEKLADAVRAVGMEAKIELTPEARHSKAILDSMMLRRDRRISEQRKRTAAR